MKQTNPYIAGPPIDEERHFFGRHAQIEKILHNLHNPKQNTFLLYGPRRCGKTSLLKQLEFYLDGEGITRIYFDLSSKSRLYLDELLYEIAQTISNACGFQPPRLENFDREGQFFAHVFLPTLEKMSQPDPVVLLFDEFDTEIKTGPGQASREFLPYLLKQSQRLKRTKIICCLGRSTTHLALHSDFSVFLPVPRLSKTEMTALVRQTEIENSLFWDDASVEKIWENTQGHPYLTQMLCNICWSTAQKTGRDTSPKVISEDVDVALETAMPYTRKLFQWIWDGLHAREQAVVFEMAQQGNAAFDSRQICDLLGKREIKTQADEIEPALKKLALLDVLELVDPGKKQFVIAVPLFAQWIAANKPQSKLRRNASVKAAKKRPVQPQPTGQPENAFDEAVGLEKNENWNAACKIYEKILVKSPENEEIKERLRHARNQERLADRYHKALKALSAGDLENAKKLLAEVILRDPAYKEAPRFLLLATTGIDAKEIKQKLDHDKKELARAKSHISHLQEEISKVRKNGDSIHSKPQQFNGSDRDSAGIEIDKRETLQKLAKTNEEPSRQQSDEQIAPDRAQESRKRNQADTSRQREENAKPSARKTDRGKNAISEIAKLKNVSLDKRPKQVPTKNTNLRDALLALDYVLDVAEDNVAAESIHTKSPTQSEKIPESISTKNAPVSNKIQPVVEVGDKSLQPAVKADRAESPVQRIPDKRISNRDTTLQEILTRLDTTIDSSTHPNVGSKSKTQIRAEKTSHQNREIEVEQPTPVIAMVAEKESAVFTDTALIEAGQVQKIPKPEHKNREASSDKPTSSESDYHQPEIVTDVQATKNHAGPASVNGQKRNAHETESPEEPVPVSPPGLRHSNADFRKIVWGKKSVLKEQKRKKLQASWVAGTLNSLPVFIWVMWLWYINPLEWGNGGKIFVLIASIPAWLLVCLFGASDKEKHITSFFALTPVVSFCFFAILTFESMRPDVPQLIHSDFELLLLAGLIYVLVIAIISVTSGQVASVVSLGTAAGACAGIILILSGGGAIEATILIMVITIFTLVMKKIDISSAASVGVMAGIPAGFLLFAVTFRLNAPSTGTSLQAGFFSLIAYLVTAGLVYEMNTLLTKMNTKPRL
jgi:energy-coupling factor transporter ATP-binding protein EcfA2